MGSLCRSSRAHRCYSDVTFRTVSFRAPLRISNGAPRTLEEGNGTKNSVQSLFESRHTQIEVARNIGSLEKGPGGVAKGPEQPHSPDSQCQLVFRVAREPPSRWSRFSFCPSFLSLLDLLGSSVQQQSDYSDITIAHPLGGVPFVKKSV